MQTIVGKVGINNSKYFNTKVIQYSVIAFKGTTYYARSLDQTQLLKSIDNCATFAVIWTAPSGIIVTAHVTNSNAVIVFTTASGGTQQGKVYQSTDDAVFTKVLENIAAPLNSKGVSSTGNIVCFGEYSLTNGDAVRIYKSTDSGATWSVSLDVGVSSDTGLRHFHSCQFLVEAAGFIATTGDINMNWYHSYDAITWVNICSSTSQRRRTLSILSLRRNELIWSCDAGTGYEGVFTTSLSDNRLMSEKDVARISKLPKTSYAMSGYGNVIIATTRATNGYTYDKNVSTFITIDGGNTWKEEGYYPLRSGVVDGGYFDIIGPDINGKYYALLDGAVGVSDRSTIVFTPNFRSSFDMITDSIPTKNADVIYPYNQLSIRDTVAKTITVDCSKYTEIFVYTKNTLDQNVTLTIDLNGDCRPNIWNGSAFVADRSVSIPGLNNSAAYLLNTRFTWLNKAVSDTLLFNASCASNPTSGSFSMIIIGITKI